MGACSRDGCWNLFAFFLACKICKCLPRPSWSHRLEEKTTRISHYAVRRLRTSLWTLRKHRGPRSHLYLRSMIEEEGSNLLSGYQVPPVSMSFRKLWSNNLILDSRHFGSPSQLGSVCWAAAAYAKGVFSCMSVACQAPYYRFVPMLSISKAQTCLKFLVKNQVAFYVLGDWLMSIILMEINLWVLSTHHFPTCACQVMIRQPLHLLELKQALHKPG